MDTPCKAAASTDPGQRRHNEDCFHVDEGAGLFIVADGVGGRDAGEIASRLTCETIAASQKTGASLAEAIREAHAVVRRAVEEDEERQSGMASTVVALQLNGPGYTLAWAGDSRAYLWTGDRLLGLTRDHSLLEQLIARGELSRAEARDHPQKNVILSGVGGDRDGIQIGSNAGEYAQWGVFLLCSDGLSDVVDYATICAILARDQSLAKRAATLTDTARDAGGRDNITAVLVDCPPPDPDAGNAAFTPEIYEVYEIDSGELTWPGDERRTPTVQRVRSRNSEGAGAAATMMIPVHRAGPAEAPRRRGALWFAILIPAGVVIAVVLYNLYGKGL